MGKIGENRGQTTFIIEATLALKREIFFAILKSIPFTLVPKLCLGMPSTTLRVEWTRSVHEWVPKQSLGTRKWEEHTVPVDVGVVLKDTPAYGVLVQGQISPLPS
jgi:hypothetical protein